MSIVRKCDKCGEIPAALFHYPAGIRDEEGTYKFSSKDLCITCAYTIFNNILQSLSDRDLRKFFE